MALGSVIDRKATPQEFLFLPDYVFKSFEEGRILDKPLVRSEKTIFESLPEKKSSTYFTPLLVFIGLGFLVLIITYRDFKRKSRSKWLDFFLFFLTGIIGLLVVLLWFATDHTATQQNFNSLWAFVPNLFVGFLLLKKQLRPWIEKYLILLLALLSVTLLIWVLKIQVFSIAILPVIVSLGIRYPYLIRYIKKAKA